MDPTALPARRPDLDWIRVGAFMLLILYHVGMFYVPWDWHVKSPRLYEGLEPVMWLTNPWRLDLLFLVSGAATRFMADRLAAEGKGGGTLAHRRLRRLGWPLLLAVFVIVPPQSYYEIKEQAPQLLGSVSDFYVKYVTGSGGWCDTDGCLTTPTYNHMWFVAYLLIYTLVLSLLLGLFPRLGQGLQRLLERACRGWGLVVWPVAVLALLRFTLLPMFDITHDFRNDWYNHALSFLLFLFGFGYARSEALAETFVRLRWPSLGLWAAGYALYATYAWTWRADDAVPPEALRMAMRVIYAAQVWGAIGAVLGFGKKWLTRGGPVLSYLTQGVFPFYIVHQTLIVVMAHHLAKLALPIAEEASILIGATYLGCLAAYEGVRRIGWLRPLFGLKPAARKAQAPPLPARRWEDVA